MQQVVHQERQRRRAAETAAAELRGQLDEISALLFTSQQRGAAGRMASSHGPGPADLLRGVLAEAAAAQRAAAAAGAAAAAAADDAALVARMVACVCARAAVAADMGADWAAERAVLERRLDQAVRMGQAMLKHHKEHSAGGRRVRGRRQAAGVVVQRASGARARALLIPPAGAAAAAVAARIRPLRRPLNHAPPPAMTYSPPRPAPPCFPARLQSPSPGGSSS